MLSNINQRQKEKYRMILLIRAIQRNKSRILTILANNKL